MQSTDTISPSAHTRHLWEAQASDAPTSMMSQQVPECEFEHSNPTSSYAVNTVLGEVMDVQAEGDVDRRAKKQKLSSEVPPPPKYKTRPPPALALLAAQQQQEKTSLQQRNVYISGLPENFHPSALRAMCAVFGPIEASKLCMEKEARMRCKGYGFVLFFHPESARDCISSLHLQPYQGKHLQVRRADLSAVPQPMAMSAGRALGSSASRAHDGDSEYGRVSQEQQRLQRGVQAAAVKKPATSVEQSTIGLSSGPIHSMPTVLPTAGNIVPMPAFSSSTSLFYNSTATQHALAAGSISGCVTDAGGAMDSYQAQAQPHSQAVSFPTTQQVPSSGLPMPLGGSASSNILIMPHACNTMYAVNQPYMQVAQAAPNGDSVGYSYYSGPVSAPAVPQHQPGYPVTYYFAPLQ